MGFTNEEWSNLGDQGKLQKHLKAYNDSNIEFGIESAADKLLSVTPPPEFQPLPEQKQADTSDSDSQDESENKTLGAPETGTKKVTFNIQPRPKRTIRAPEKLNL